jgi:hypothetical protein
MSETQGSRNFFANSAIVALSSIRDPLSPTTIVFAPEPAVKSKGPPKMAFDEAPKQKEPTEVPTYFKMLVAAVFILTIIAGIVCVIMSVFAPNPTPSEQSTLEMMQTTWKMGFGGFLGLIGGKAAS